MVRLDPGSSTLRVFSGPQADEISLICRPQDRSPDTEHQAERVYRDLVTLLSEHRASLAELACETIFLRDARRDVPLVLEVRERILAEASRSASPLRPAFIQQAPVDRGSNLELAAMAVLPRRRDDWSVRDVAAEPSCRCEGCARSGARIVRLGAQESLYTTNVYGVGRDAYEQAWNTFRAAEDLLQRCGMGFHDVVRTWIHLRDIARDYAVLNQVRRDFFQHCGIARRPASTGVQGVPLPDAHDFSLIVHAVRSPHPPQATVLSTPYLSEAWTYGADFSRGLRIVEANKVTLHVSGTASIDEAGQTAHVGDAAAQIGRMLDNIGSLLAREGAGFANVVSGVTYLRDADDAPLLRSMFRERGFDGFPCALLEAPLCRPQLLCEAEAVAFLPLAPPGA